MKNLRKLLALMLVLAMSVCVFAACGKKAVSSDDDDDEGSSKTNSPEYVVKYCLDAYIDLDIENLKKYYYGDDGAIEKIRKMVEEYTEASRAVMERASYEITDVDEDEEEGKAVVYVTLSMPQSSKPDVELIKEAEVVDENLIVNLELVDDEWRIVKIKNRNVN